MSWPSTRGNSKRRRRHEHNEAEASSFAQQNLFRWLAARSFFEALMWTHGNKHVCRFIQYS